MQIVLCQINETLDKQATNSFPLNLCYFCANCALSRITRFLCYFVGPNLCLCYFFTLFHLCISSVDKNNNKTTTTKQHRITLTRRQKEKNYKNTQKKRRQKGNKTHKGKMTQKGRRKKIVILLCFALFQFLKCR